jgi:hypothetical protein
MVNREDLLQVGVGNMAWWQPVVFVLAILTGTCMTRTHAACDARLPENCTVSKGHAQCEAWDIRASIEALPSCVTTLSFSLLPLPELKENRIDTIICLDDVANFSHVPHLEEVTLFTNKSHFYYVSLNGSVSQCLRSLHALPKLLVLRIQMRLQGLSLDNESYASLHTHFKHLDTLELTRSRIYGVVYAQHMLGPVCGRHYMCALWLFVGVHYGPPASIGS